MHDATVLAGSDLAGVMRRCLVVLAAEAATIFFFLLLSGRFSLLLLFFIYFFLPPLVEICARRPSVSAPRCLPLACLRFSKTGPLKIRARGTCACC